MEYIQNLLSFIQPHMILVAVFTNIVIDVLKPYLSKLPMRNGAIYRIFAFMFGMAMMFVLDSQIDMRVTPLIDGMIAACITVLFYDTKIYPWIRDKFVEKRSAL